MNTKYIIFVFIFWSAFFQCSSVGINQDSDHYLNDKWLVELNLDGVGTVKTIMNFEVEGEKFSAHTRKNADREIFGWWTSFLARLFTDKFRGGSLLRIKEGRISESGDTTRVQGILKTPIGSYNLDGILENGLLKGELKNNEQEKKGTVKGTKDVPEIPLSNYPAVINNAFSITKEKIYDKSFTGTKEWKNFEEKITEIAAKAQDDIEMIFAFYYYSGKLPFTHYSLYKSAFGQGYADTDKPTQRYAFLDEKSTKTAYLKIISFSGSAKEIDSIFAIIIERNYKNLIIDLRKNPGGSLPAGLKIATNIVNEVHYGGAFLTRKWFDNHDRLPQINDYAKFPIISEANMDLFNKLYEEEGICLKVIPEKNTFRGRVFILTSNKTASTCEPIIYGFKQYNMATIVGEKTSGAMLSSSIFELQDDFIIALPTADYYTSDGYRIDGKGVEPNIKVESDKALDYVLKNLIKDF